MTGNPAETGSAVGDVTLVGLRWAIKGSFLDYIARAPGGTGALSDGALATETRQVVFGPDGEQRLTADHDGRSLAFRGTVTFKAYSGVLFVRISNPAVTINDGIGELTVVDPFNGEGEQRLRLATFEIEDHLIVDGFEHWAASNVRLAQEGRELFNDVYPAGELLEPITIIVANKA